MVFLTKFACRLCLTRSEPHSYRKKTELLFLLIVLYKLILNTFTESNSKELLVKPRFHRTFFAAKGTRGSTVGTRSTDFLWQTGIMESLSTLAEPQWLPCILQLQNPLKSSIGKSVGDVLRSSISLPGSLRSLSGITGY